MMTTTNEPTEKTNNDNIIICFDSEVEAINTSDGYGNAVNTISDIVTNGIDRRTNKEQRRNNKGKRNGE